MAANVPALLTSLIVAADISLLIGIVVAFLWVRLRLPKDDRGARLLALAAPVLMAVWLLVAYVLSTQGFFIARLGGPLIPTIVYGILGPILLFAPVVLWSRAFGRILDEFSQAVLIGYQAYRMLGVLFFMAFGAGLLPAVFAYPAGIGDILTGLFAIVTALAYLRYRLAAGWLVTSWNWFGIVDLTVAVFLGFVSSPGVFQMLSIDAPNEMISTYPLVLVPVFAVPVSILLHCCSLRKLRRDRNGEGREM